MKNYVVSNDKVRNLLIQDPKSQQDKSKEIGLSQPMVSRLESGVKESSDLKVKDLVKIANHYGIPINELIEIKDQV